MVWPAIIAGAAGLLGSSIAADSAEDQATQNANLQREFAQYGIRWKVDDAKAAGLHPLYALGGSGAAFAPNPITINPMAQALGDMGQNVARAIQAQQTPEEREKHAASVGVMKAQIAKDEAQAAYYNSLAARGAQEGVFTNSFPVMSSVSPIRERELPWVTSGHGDVNHGRPGGLPPPDKQVIRAPQLERKPDNYADRVSLEANKVISHAEGDTSRTAGKSPFFTTYTTSDRPGYRRTFFDLPQTEEGPGEAMENIPWYLWPSIISHNIRRHGLRAPYDFITGSAPRMRHDVDLSGRRRYYGDR